MFIRPWITREVVTITPDTSIADAIRTMQDCDLRRLPVVKGGELLGLVTERDILEAGGNSSSTVDWDIREEHEKQTVSKIMSTNPVTGHPGMLIEEVALVMAERRISSLPIVENDRLIGIVTDTDLYHAIATVMHKGEKESHGAIFEVNAREDIRQILKLIAARDATLLTLLSKPLKEHSKALMMRVTLEGPDAEDAISAITQAGYRILRHL